MLCTYIYCTLYSICAVYSVQQKRGVGGQNKACLCTQCDMWIVDGHHALISALCVKADLHNQWFPIIPVFTPFDISLLWILTIIETGAA